MSQPNGTLPPTASRVREFRSRGDIARSRDTVAAAALGGAVIALLLTAGRSWAELVNLVEAACLQPASGGQLADLAPLAARALRVAFAVAGPPLLGAVLGALLAIALQLGWPPALWSRRRARRGRGGQAAASPISQLRQAFGPPAMVRRAVVTIAKLAAIVGSMAIALSPRQLAAGAEPQQLLGGLAACCTTALVTSSLVILALGLLDYASARRRVVARMRMTHDELRRELREMEGDPAIKSRRQRRRGELARQRFTAATAEAVATAAVVVLAPGEAAVALRYRGRAGEPAPQLVAKGQGVLADHLAQLARDREVPVFEKPELARALAELRDRQSIPPELYRGVAELLAAVLARPGHARPGGLAPASLAPAVPAPERIS